MNLILALIVSQSVSPAEAINLKVDAEAAIRIAKRSLSVLGASRPAMDEISLMRHYTNGRIPYWAVGLVASDGRKCSALIDSTDGRLLYASFFNPSAPKGSGPTSGADQVKTEKLAWQFVRGVAREKNLQADSIDVGGDGLAHAAFDIVVNGKRFFNNNPAFRYTLLFFPRQKSAYIFTAFDHLPPIRSTPGSISKRKAAEILRKYVSTSPEFVEQTKPNGNLGKPNFNLELESGYYLRRGETTARTVWLGVAKIYRPTPFSKLEVGTVRRLVDASTGESFPIVDNDAEMR